jgi:hypothetical protein
VIVLKKWQYSGKRLCKEVVVFKKEAVFREEAVFTD